MSLSDLSYTACILIMSDSRLFAAMAKTTLAGKHAPVCITCTLRRQHRQLGGSIYCSAASICYLLILAKRLLTEAASTIDF